MIDGKRGQVEMTCRLSDFMGYGMGYRHRPEIAGTRMEYGADERT